MCGIAGILALTDDRRVDADVVRRMTDVLAHRGPDDSGLLATADGRAALGFRRLSIIDLSGGHQPLTTPDNSTCIVCNGEIYNYRTLRSELTAAGETLTTAGDIEPILHLYRRLGHDALSRLDGFFALALVDVPNRRAILAVDRFGKKPLYTALRDNQLYFASELKALHAIGIGRDIDPAAVATFLQTGVIPAPMTIHESVRKLPPGHSLTVSLGQSQPTSPKLTHYVTVPNPPTFDGSLADAQTQLRSTLTQAVQKRLVADVPVGVLLSGGIDSSVIAALASQSASQPIPTFTVGFGHASYDERPLAKLIAERYRTQHHEIVLEPTAAEIFDRMLELTDEPFADSSLWPTSLVCRYASQHVKVVLAGDGGDEAFLGYDRYRAMAIGDAIRRKLSPKWLTKLAKFASTGGETRSWRNRLNRLLAAIDRPDAQRYSHYLSVMNVSLLNSLAGQNLRAAVVAHIDPIAAAFDATSPNLLPIDRANRADTRFYLPADLLTKIDRASMAHGLEVRSPFLDPTVVSLGLSLPTQWKHDRRRGKLIVRQTFGDLLPSAVLKGRKSGFGIPIGEWFRSRMKSALLERLNPSCRLVQLDWINGQALSAMIAEHLDRRADHGQRLWTLAVLETFVRNRKS